MRDMPCLRHGVSVVFCCTQKTIIIISGMTRIYPTNAVRIRRDPKSDVIPYDYRTAVATASGTSSPPAPHKTCGFAGNPACTPQNLRFCGEPRRRPVNCMHETAVHENPKSAQTSDGKKSPRRGYINERGCDKSQMMWAIAQRCYACGVNDVALRANGAVAVRSVR